MFSDRCQWLHILIDIEHPREDGNELEKSLYAVGLSPDDIDYVIFTHLHPDHMGHKNKFRKAVFLFQGSEKLVSYFRNDRKIIINGSCVIAFGKENEPEIRYTAHFPDMTGLGDEIYIHLMPGHTPGSVVIFAYIDRKVHAFTGDIFLNRDYFERMEPPGSSWNPSALPEQQLFIKNNSDVIIPGHGEPIVVSLPE